MCFLLGKRVIVKRLKSARGHLSRVIKMVEEDGYCIDILHQSLAVQAALKRTDELILANHLKRCVQGVLTPREKNKQIQEILELFKQAR